MPSNQPDLAGMMQAMMQAGSPRGGGGVGPAGHRVKLDGSGRTGDLAKGFSVCVRRRRTLQKNAAWREKR